MAEKNTRIRASQIRSILPSDIDATNSSIDGYFPAKAVGEDRFTWAEGGTGGSTLIIINPQIDDYTLVLTDKDKLVDMNKVTALTLTIPKNSIVAFDIGTKIALRQKGAGALTIAPIDGDVTINESNGLTLTAQYSVAWLIKVATDTWTLYGELGTTGAGDMVKATYDIDDDGIVDKAETIDDGASGGINSSSAVDVRDAVDKKHTQNTDSRIEKNINQTTHGFSVGNVLKFTGTVYALAQANSLSNSEVIGIVSEVIDTDNFILITDGYIDTLSGLTAGSIYYLSDLTAGALTTTEPLLITPFSIPLLVALSTTTGFFTIKRGRQAQTTGGIINYIKPRTGNASFVGSGLNDLTSDATLEYIAGYEGEANAIYDIKISTTGTPDKYQYRKDAGSWSVEQDIIGYSADILTGGTASAKDVTGSNVASRACDDNLSLFWRGSTTSESWWKYDLGSGITKTVKRLKIFNTVNGTQIKNFKLQGSNNDSDWDDLYSDQLPQYLDNLSSTSGFLQKIFDINNSTAYRYYRIYILDMWTTSTFPIIYEISMYEQVAGTDYINLGDNVFVKFNASIGHTLNDTWTIACQGYASTNNGSSLALAYNSLQYAFNKTPKILNHGVSFRLADGQNYYGTFSLNSILGTGTLYLFSNSFDKTKVKLSYYGTILTMQFINITGYMALYGLTCKTLANSGQCYSFFGVVWLDLEELAVGDNDNTSTVGINMNYASRGELYHITDTTDGKKVATGLRLSYASIATYASVDLSSFGDTFCTKTLGGLLLTDYDTNNNGIPDKAESVDDGAGNTASASALKAVTNINTLTEKTTPVDDDLLLLEDSEASYTRKKLKQSKVSPKIDNFTIIKDSNDALKIADRIELNIMLAHFYRQVDQSKIAYNLIDGFIDEYEDESGIDTSASTNESYDSTDDYYSPAISSEDSYTKLLLHLNNDVVDSSINNYTVTNNNVTFDNTSPKFDYYGIFNGSSSYLTVPDSDDWDFGTEDFTIECWSNFSSLLGLTQPLITHTASSSTNSGQWDLVVIDIGGGNYVIRFEAYVGGTWYTIDRSFSFNTNYWYHIAVIRTSNNLKIFVNGIQIGADASYNHDLTNASSQVLTIGAFSDGNSWFNGEIDEIRVSKGIARWTSNFTVLPYEYPIPENMTLISNAVTAVTAPETARIVIFEEDVDAITLNTDLNAYINLQADDYTKLLLHFNGTDGVTSYTAETGQIVTFNGDVQLDTAQSKFGGASLLLDGNGDYISIPDSTDWDFGTGNFTIDAWIRFNSITNTFGIYERYANGGEYIEFYWDKDYGLEFYAQTGGNVIANYTYSWTPSINIWYHVALVRNSTNIFMFVNGVSQSLTVYQAIGVSSISSASAVVKIGHNDAPADYYADGWIDEIRVSKGIARFSSGGFTVSTIEYPPIKVTLSDMGDYASGKRILSGIADISGVSGTNVNYKLITQNNKNLKIHATGLNWS